MRVSLVLVAFRSSAVLPAAVESFRQEAERHGVQPEVVIVEQSEDADEARRVRGLPIDRLALRPNRGYAAGLNAGIEAASGEVLLLGNPDVLFAPGSLAALLEALGSGWHVVGPQFTLEGFFFPPADEQTPVEELRRFRASRSPGSWERFHHSEVRRWRRVWESPGPVDVAALSGALLAAPAAVAARVGPWDEGYFLYFEETDWLRRARRSGFRTAVVPAARVEHAWGHAADPRRHEPCFGASRRRYFARHFGLAGRAASCLRLDRSPLAPPPFAAAAAMDFPVETLWLLSPSPLGFPAAGRRSDHPPTAALERFRRRCPHCETLTILAYDPASGRRLGAWRWRDGDPPVESRDA